MPVSHLPGECFGNVAPVLGCLRDSQMMLMFRQVWRRDWHKACPIMNMAYMLTEWKQCLAHTRPSRRCGCLPFPDHRPSVFIGTSEDFTLGCDSSRCGCHSWAGRHMCGCRRLCLVSRAEIPSRRRRGDRSDFACQGQPTELLLRECLMSLLSSALYTAEPRNAHYKVPLETRA